MVAARTMAEMVRASPGRLIRLAGGSAGRDRHSEQGCFPSAIGLPQAWQATDRASLWQPGQISDPAGSSFPHALQVSLVVAVPQ